MAWVREMKPWASTAEANASKLTAARTAKVQTELATMHTVCKTISSNMHERERERERAPSQGDRFKFGMI